MASGRYLWMWLECTGVVSGCCCIRRYIDILIIIITFPYSTCICSCLAAASLFLVHLKKCFFVLVYIKIAGFMDCIDCDEWHHTST